jgi:hypothetical protein
MLKKNCVFHVSVFGILLLFMACASKTPEAPELFTPVDCWEVVSIDGKSVSEHFALFGGDLSHMETKIIQNDLCFFDNGSWWWTLEFEIKADMGGGLNLIAEAGLAGKGSYNGSFTPRGGTIVMAQETLNIRLEPEDFWMSAGVSEADFKAGITSSWLFGQIERWSARATGPRLTLTNSDGIQQVLMRK